MKIEDVSVCFRESDLEVLWTPGDAQMETNWGKIWHRPVATIADLLDAAGRLQPDLGCSSDLCRRAGDCTCSPCLCDSVHPGGRQ